MSFVASERVCFLFARGRERERGRQGIHRDFRNPVFQVLYTSAEIWGWAGVISCNFSYTLILS